MLATLVYMGAISHRQPRIRAHFESFFLLITIWCWSFSIFSLSHTFIEFQRDNFAFPRIISASERESGKHDHIKPHIFAPASRRWWIEHVEEVSMPVNFVRARESVSQCVQWYGEVWLSERDSLINFSSHLSQRPLKWLKITLPLLFIYNSWRLLSLRDEWVRDSFITKYLALLAAVYLSTTAREFSWCGTISLRFETTRFFHCRNEPLHSRALRCVWWS